VSVPLRLVPSSDDPRDAPAYTYPEASRALNIPASTLGAWTRGQTYPYKGGRHYFEPLIHRSDRFDTRLSYHNIIEAHALRALRTVHEISLAAVREALDVAERQFGIKRLLIHRDFRFAPKELFLRQYADLVTLSKGQQIVMGKVLEMYLRRVEYDASGHPNLFYPLTRGTMAADSPKIIALSPLISFGRPVILRCGISTPAIYSRIDAGESLEHVRDDYGLTDEEIEEALLYEAAA
jgi:uncharacterized protein (DUF433 family)